MKHLSLFSGIGGIDLAAEWAGFESVAFVERDNFCQQVLSNNFPGVPIFGDVCEFDGTEYENKIDLVSAGFPCQPFSQAGKRKGASDERALWPQVCRILRETKPQWFLGENVPGLLTIDGGQYFGQILNDLAEIGYSAGWIVYGAKDVGAVHRRNRVFIVAHSNSVRCSQYSSEEGQQPRSRRTARCWVEGYDSRFCGPSSTNAESEPSNGGGFAEQLCSESQTSELGSGDCKGDVAHSENESCNVPNARQSLSYRQKQEQFGGGYSKPSSTDSNGSGCEKQRERVSTEAEHKTSERCCYQPILGGDWKQWGISPTIGIEPRVRRGNDGVPNRVDRLKSLGNAVVPQQVYPILVEIARQMK